MTIPFFVSLSLWAASVGLRGDDPQQPATKPVAESARSSEKPPTAAATPEAAVALAMLGGLTPEHLKELGRMLEQDWSARPEWGDMAIAIMKGERMRVGMGWWRATAKRYDWNWLKARFDGDGNGQIDESELSVPGLNPTPLFARLDRDLDGRVTPADLEAVEPGMMPLNPAAMPAIMANYLFYRLDHDSNGRVTLEEIAAFFAAADGEDLGFLTPEDLRAAIDDPAERQARSQPQSGGEPTSSEMLRMLLSGQLGWLESGPELGSEAPDFSLPTHDGAKSVALSASRGKKPVVLIFGSFT